MEKERNSFIDTSHETDSDEDGTELIEPRESTLILSENKSIPDADFSGFSQSSGQPGFFYSTLYYLILTFSIISLLMEIPGGVFVYREVREALDTFIESMLGTVLDGGLGDGVAAAALTLAVVEFLSAVLVMRPRADSLDLLGLTREDGRLVYAPSEEDEANASAGRFYPLLKKIGFASLVGAPLVTFCACNAAQEFMGFPPVLLSSLPKRLGGLGFVFLEGVAYGTLVTGQDTIEGARLFLSALSKRSSARQLFEKSPLIFSQVALKLALAVAYDVSFYGYFIPLQFLELMPELKPFRQVMLTTTLAANLFYTLLSRTPEEIESYRMQGLEEKLAELVSHNELAVTYGWPTFRSALKALKPAAFLQTSLPSFVRASALGFVTYFYAHRATESMLFGGGLGGMTGALLFLHAFYAETQRHYEFNRLSDSRTRYNQGNERRKQSSTPVEVGLNVLRVGLFGAPGVLHIESAVDIFTKLLPLSLPPAQALAVWMAVERLLVEEKFMRGKFRKSLKALFESLSSCTRRNGERQPLLLN